MHYLCGCVKAIKLPELGVDPQLSEHRFELFQDLSWITSMNVNLRPVLLDCHLDILMHDISGNINCLKWTLPISPIGFEIQYSLTLQTILKATALCSL